MSHGRRLLAQNMNAFDPDNRTSKRNSHGAVRWTWLAAAGALIVLLYLAFERTVYGKALRATAVNRLGAKLMGIPTEFAGRLSFFLCALIGALAGILIAPITFTSWDAGVMLGLKGFAAAILGGLGSGPGAIAGGLALGLLEALGAGYVSSAYKDVIAFVIILAVLVFMPSGLAGRASHERV